MTSKLTALTLLTLGIGTSGLIGCGNGAGKEGDPQAIDSVTVRQAITANTKDLAANISTTIQFLDASELFQSGADFASASATVDCGAPVDSPDSVDCGEPSQEPLDLDLNDDADAMTDELELRVLAEANVESESEFAVTYLIRGSVFCAQDDAPADPECVADIDAAQIRLAVSSPSSGNMDVDVLVGPDRVNPVSFQFHRGLLALEADLGGIADSIDHLGAIVGETPELPATFEGRVRVEVSSTGSNQIAGAISVLQAIKVADGDFSFAIGQSIPLYALAVDGAAKTLRGEANASAVDGSFPITEYIYDAETGLDSESTYDLGFHLSAAKAVMLLDAAAESLKVEGISLGNEPATLSVDGAEVASLELNANDGGTFDLVVTEDNGATKIEVSPLLDLRLALKLAAAADALGEVDDWMLDEVLSIRLDGAAKPALRVDGDQVEVLEGTLSMSMQNAGITHTAAAGQCMLSSADDAPIAVEPGDEPLPIEETSANPLEDVTVGACL